MKASIPGLLLVAVTTVAAGALVALAGLAATEATRERSLEPTGDPAADWTAWSAAEDRRAAAFGPLAAPFALGVCAGASIAITLGGLWWYRRHRALLEAGR